MNAWRPMLATLFAGLVAGCGPSDPAGAIHTAAKSGDLGTVRSVLKKNPELAKHEDGTSAGRKRTPLHDAASRAVAELLVQNGADVKAKDVMDWTPLHTARNAEVAEYLLAQGVSVTARAQRKLTPLHVAADAGVAAALLKAGASINDVADSMTPLHWQILEEHVDVVQLLLERGASTTLNSRDKSTYMHLAAKHSKPETIQLLAARGLSVNARDGLGVTPLHEAVHDDHLAVVEALLAAHAEVNPKLSANVALQTFPDGRMREQSVANATPFDLAKTDEMRALLQRSGGVSGVGGKLPPSQDVNAALRREVMAADYADRGPPAAKPRSPQATAPTAPPPAPPRSAPAATAAAPVSAADPYTLRGIGGSAARRVALIHSGIKTYTLAAGDSATFQIPTGNADVRCVEIRADSVVIQVSGEASTRELKMR